ncbi:MAG TPA: AtpZ/AtpI family protein [bacterium]|nr:AtpZ/AtpI family protein [bacterium]
MNRDPSPLVAYGVYGAAGVQLAAAVVALMLAGGWADEKLGTEPWLTVTGIALGFVGGLANLVRIVGWFNRKSSDETRERKAK